MKDIEKNILGWVFFVALCLSPFTWQIKFLILTSLLFITTAIHEVGSKTLLESIKINLMIQAIFHLEDDDDKKEKAVQAAVKDSQERLQSKSFEKQIEDESGATRTTNLYLFFVYAGMFVIVYLSTLKDFGL
jgi:biopolymer transport protein ExbB/TolQ